MFQGILMATSDFCEIQNQVIFDLIWEVKAGSNRVGVSLSCLQIPSCYQDPLLFA